MSDQYNIVTLTAGTTDGVDWQEELNGAFLLATDAQEGFRSWRDLSDHIYAWWYATLEDRLQVYYPANGPLEVTYG